MSVLVVGLSHRTAPVALLERVALTADGVEKLARDAVAADHVSEAVVLSTCNRTEVYASVEKFHGGVADVSAALCVHTGVGLDELTPHLYVHYEDRAVQHLFTVACGLDSMVVGEAQILGQVKQALRAAQDAGAAGRILNELVQQATRVGKRAHAETDIDGAGRSLVDAGLDLAAAAAGELSGARALVVGAGSMSALAASVLARRGAGAVTVANRTEARAERVAEAVGGSAVPLGEVEPALAQADVIVSCTGAVGVVLPEDLVRRARRNRGDAPQFFLDLALPHDIDRAIADLDGVTLVDLERLGQVLEGHERAADLDAVRRIVVEEVAAFLAWQRAASVSPTVVALRSMAAQVVDRELMRLAARLPHLTDADRDEIAHTVRRTVEKLLHAPTVRVKELADSPGGQSYAEALRELFDLDLRTVEALSQAEGTPRAGGEPRRGVAL